MTLKPLPYQKIFVVGCPRSGTSWVANMISQHPDVINLPGESHLYKLFYDPFTYLHTLTWRQRAKRKKWLITHYGIRPMLTGFNHQNLWAALPRLYRLYQRKNDNAGPYTCVDYERFLDLFNTASIQEKDGFARVNKLIASILDTAFYQRNGTSDKVLLEKTPMHLKHVDVILNSFPEAKVVEVVRDVRDVCSSWQSRAATQRWARKSTEEIVGQWKRGVELGEKFRSDPMLKERIIKVHYEDLKKDTTTSLTTLFNFLEQPITEQQIADIAANTNISNVKQKGEGLHVRKGIIGAWRTDLSQPDISTCHQLAGPLLDKLGYSVA